MDHLKCILLDTRHNKSSDRPTARKAASHSDSRHTTVIQTCWIHLDREMFTTRIDSEYDEGNIYKNVSLAIGIFWCEIKSFWSKNKSADTV